MKLVFIAGTVGNTVEFDSLEAAEMYPRDGQLQNLNVLEDEENGSQRLWHSEYIRGGGPGANETWTYLKGKPLS